MKRWTLRICVLLLLGAIVNIAVAWACAATSGASISAGEIGLRQPDSGDVAWWLELFPTSGISLGPITTEQEQTDAYVERLVISEARAFGLKSRYFSNHDGIASTTWAGWPCYGVTGCWLYRGDRQVREDSGLLRLPWFSDNRVWFNVFDRVLPVQVVWPGFVINTLFYAGILWLLFAAPFALQRRRRINRGLCPACAYPVGQGDVCTECGKAVIQSQEN